jgi:hypothetical protein
MQARWPREQVRIEGDANEYVRISDEGEERSFFFCPCCGATVYYWTSTRVTHGSPTRGTMADVAGLLPRRQAPGRLPRRGGLCVRAPHQPRPC